MKFKLSAFILSFLACFALWSCGPKKDDQNDKAKDFDKAEGSPTDGVKGIIYDIPPPSEIPYLLMSVGAEFNQSLVNDRKKSSSYESQSTKASLNLGAYTADIGYLCAYDKTQEAIDYLNSCQILADKIGVSNSFDKKFLKDFESKIGNKEALGILLDSAAKTSSEQLNRLNQTQSNLGAMLVTGTYVESLYILTGIIKSYPKDLLPTDSRNNILTPLIKLVFKQEKSVSEVIKMLSAVDQSGSIPTILADFKTLEASFKALNLDEKIKTNTSNLSLKPEMLTDVTKVVEKLRGDIVQ